jgi:putative ABC transport system permease protein
VVAQVALSVVLLAGSGLLLRSFAEVNEVDPGFDPTSSLMAEVQLPRARYPDAASVTGFFTQFLRETEALPGVESATLVSHVPVWAPRNTWRVRPAGEEGEGARTFVRTAFPGYFETLRISRRAGRGFQDSDVRDGPRVALLSETAARTFFPGEEAVGRTVVMETFQDPVSLEVVGVVGDVHLTTLEADPEVAMYTPFAQAPQRIMQVVLRSRGDPRALADPLRGIMREMDPELPLKGLSTLEAVISDSVAQRRTLTLTLTLYALFPLLLAAVGLYAVLAYHVARRSHEIGIRMALGAEAGKIGRMVLGEGLGLVAVGLVLGMAGAAAATRLLRELLFGVTPGDPLTFMGVGAFVLGVALAACMAPAWRAIRSDPRKALEAA